MPSPPDGAIADLALRPVLGRAAARAPRRSRPGAAAGALLPLLCVLWMAGGASAVARPGVDPAAGGPSETGLVLTERYDLADAWEPDLPTPGTQLYHPEGLDVSPDGVVAVAERGNNVVSLWHADGESVGRWGTAGSLPGQFEAPEDVAFGVEAGTLRLYVADTGNHRVQVLDGRTGAFVAEWPVLGTPRGLAVGADGTVYVSDGAENTIRVFAANGTPLGRWGSAGRATGQLNEPMGLDVAADGTVYVADSGNQRVQWFDPTGASAGWLSLDNTAGPGGAPLDVAMSDAGQMYVAVERAVLRFANRSVLRETIYPLEEEPSTGCLPGRCCVQYQPITNNHEGVRRLALLKDGGPLFSYAPSLRWKDRITAYPARWTPSHWPACGIPDNRHATDPKAIDAGRDPYVHVLDTSTSLHVYRTDGRWYDEQLGAPAGIGSDLSAGALKYLPEGPGINHPRTYTAVLNANEISFYSVHKDGCASCTAPGGCPPEASIRVLAPNEELEQQLGAVHWNRALSFMECGPSLAVLDTGVPQVVVRQYTAVEPPPRFATPAAAGVRLVGRQQIFRSYSDLEYGADDRLWVLARDGALLPFDEHGREGDEIALQGLAGRSAEALAVGRGSSLFVLTDDEWIFKFGLDGVPTAAWSVVEQAGPGRYQDIAVDVLGQVAVTDGDHDRVVVFRQSETPPESPAAPARPSCRVATAKSASPASLPLGSTTDVTLALSGDCPDGRDLVLIVDGSCQMTGDRMVGAREGALRLIDGLRPGRDRLALVSITGTRGGARLRAPLTDDVDLLRTLAATMPTECLPGGGREGQLSEGLRVGREALFGPLGRANTKRTLILVTASVVEADRANILHETRLLWDRDVRLVTVAVGPDAISRRHEPDRGLMAAIARPVDAFRYSAPGAVPDVLAALTASSGPSLLFDHLEVVDRLPPNMRLLAGSSSPPATQRPDGSLAWSFDQVALDHPPTMSYTLQPLDPGRWPTNVEATGRNTDGLGAGGQALFPVPIVDVWAPTPSATERPSPTATATPMHTATPTASASPSPTDTLAPSSTPTAPPRRVFLPVTYRQQCVPSKLPVDVVLVLDTSSSMGGDKIDAAAAAARGFVALLDLPGDHAAVVAFHNRARLLQPLTGDRQALERALGSLQTEVGTRMDLALWEAMDALNGPAGRPQADAVIVLLTDGQAQGGTEPQVSLAAALAREMNVTVYTIGLGADVNPAMLAEISGRPDRVYLAPGPRDLLRIYGEIARVIPCR